METDGDEAWRRAAVGCALATLTVLLAVAIQDPLSLSPTPMRTSILSGQMWLDELLVGHPERFREQFGMSKHAFQLLSRELQLCGRLVNRRHVTVDEQLATFLYFARTGSSTRILQERFQRSASTISGCVHLFSILSYYCLTEHPVQLNVSSMPSSRHHSIRSTSKHLPIARHHTSREITAFSRTSKIAEGQLTAHILMPMSPMRQLQGTATGRGVSRRTC